MVLLPLSAAESASAAQQQPEPQPSAAAEPTTHVPEQGTHPPGEPDPKFIEECEADPEAQSLKGRVYHRGVWCQTAEVELPTARGEATLDITAAAYADPAARRVRVFYRVNDWNTDLVNLPWINGGRTLRMRLNCDNQCGVIGNDDADKSKALTEWRVPSRDLPARQPNWVSWDITSPDTGSGPERMLQHLWQFQGTLEGQPLLSDDHEFGLPEHSIRCDSAGLAPGYGNWTPRACINDDVLPFITYKKSDPLVGQVAHHIDYALNKPRETFPNFGSAKSIPGKYTGSKDTPGLHRVAYDSEVANANRRVKDAIRDRQGEWNGPDDLPPKERPEMQADEYPFATTEEGLSRATAEDGIFDASVAWVDGDQNTVAGNQLQEFYRKDRVLFGGRDEFWVNVQP
ncbi:MULTISPECIES: hypothetical protein [unclassified Streptomyces]|uniref:NucA/NucB deoxyribonuclease domain-containing protein n=1 Tax=unclassified Streptomyces TaxID=2593676 RepID=UPI00168AC219|nr:MULTISPECIES: hypothetical protein [unclassified Streptomyces]MBD3008504.1 hypothetical protein [Streptomyces sp. 5-10]